MIKRLSQRSIAALGQHQKTAKRRHKARFKASNFAVYSGVFAVIVALVAVGYQEPEREPVLANNVVPDVVTNGSISVDEVVAAGVAANVAQTTSLAIAPNASNLAVSVRIRNDLAQSSGGVNLDKPQIIEPTVQNKSVVKYTVRSGDTLGSVASQFGVSKQTIQWANDMTNESLAAGSTLRIPPVNGVLYVVESGDSLGSIASKYNVQESRVVSYNDLEISGLRTNTEIILPGGVLPERERPGYVAPVVATNSYLGTGFGGSTWRIKVGSPGLRGNTYAYGNCTYYAFDRRVELGKTVGDFWGNAATWAAQARAQGMTVNSTPGVGAIMQNGGGWGGFGHVAIVEKVLPNGDIEVSEMNASVAGGGWNVVSGRTIPASNTKFYAYIH